MPHELRARWVAGVPEPAAEAGDQFDGIAEARWWRSLAGLGEDGEDAQLSVGEQQLPRQVRHLAPEPDHQLNAPRHHHLDRDGALQPLGRVMLQFLDLAA